MLAAGDVLKINVIICIIIVYFLLCAATGCEAITPVLKDSFDNCTRLLRMHFLFVRFADGDYFKTVDRFLVDNKGLLALKQKMSKQLMHQDFNLMLQHMCI